MDLKLDTHLINFVLQYIVFATLPLCLPGKSHSLEQLIKSTSDWSTWKIRSTKTLTLNYINVLHRVGTAVAQKARERSNWRYYRASFATVWQQQFLARSRSNLYKVYARSMLNYWNKEISDSGAFALPLSSCGLNFNLLMRGLDLRGVTPSLSPLSMDLAW